MRPKCIPTNPERSIVKLKSTDEPDDLYPYGIIYEFFKMHFAEQILTREASKPERLEHLFERQIHLMNNVMRPTHRIWRRCSFICSNKDCSLDELRSYHDQFCHLSIILAFKEFLRSLVRVKDAQELTLRSLSDAFMEFIDERIPGTNTKCKTWNKKFRKREQRITRKVLRIAP